MKLNQDKRLLDRIMKGHTYKPEHLAFGITLDKFTGKKEVVIGFGHSKLPPVVFELPEDTLVELRDSLNEAIKFKSNKTANHVVDMLVGEEVRWGGDEHMREAINNAVDKLKATAKDSKEVSFAEFLRAVADGVDIDDKNKAA